MATRNPQKTRERLLQTAFQEMHAHGFQGMRVDEILKLSGLQKGAFYHHFGSKTELGYAVLEEQIKPLIEHIWLEPLAELRNPIQDLPRFLNSLDKRITPAMREHGCPLNNLAQEMACLDEGFQKRIAKLFSDWINAFQAMLEKGQQQGYIRKNVDCHQVARFLIAVLEGCISLFKVEHSPEQWQACRTQLPAYMASLRPDDIQ
ncbi:MAG TPA: TetR/AcrR family transcriptional regulator [Gammaproteobacteria bacterium]|nr:TetR/AcrR family transcriptional regulator [Gammaproteobacteria bacterium]